MTRGRHFPQGRAFLLQGERNIIRAKRQTDCSSVFHSDWQAGRSAPVVNHNFCWHVEYCSWIFILYSLYTRFTAFSSKAYKQYFWCLFSIMTPCEVKEFILCPVHTHTQFIHILRILYHKKNPKIKQKKTLGSRGDAMWGSAGCCCNAGC